MAREHCTMWEELCGKIYCGYYDIGVMLCVENQDCPEELDDDSVYDPDLDMEIDEIDTDLFNSDNY